MTSIMTKAIRFGIQSQRLVKPSVNAVNSNAFTAAKMKNKYTNQRTVAPINFADSFGLEPGKAVSSS